MRIRFQKAEMLYKDSLYTTDYKNKRMAELKIKLARLKAKAKRTKHAMRIFDTDMIDAMTPPKRPSKKDIQRFIETD